MRNLKNWLVVVLLVSTSIIFGQTKLTGTIVDETNQPLPGASVVLKGAASGASSDFDGKFTFETKVSNGTIAVSFVGYETQSLSFSGSKDFGTITLKPSAEALSEVVIVGVADIAKDRKTPVAVSTIKASEIIEKLGSQEFPEILNETPSVYATKQGGGFGDARINIRGFDQRNVAVMINGMPVNDMENGWVYWSNWAGLSDVTTAMQVQRGLGSSKLAISSVGGTINIITKTSDKKEGGVLSSSFGNDNYLKFIGSYSTGLLDNGLSATFLLSRTTGDGYVDGTKFEGHNYFIGIGYKPNDKHNFQFTFTGAPQWHHQRSWANPISDYLKYGNGTDPNIKYNSDWGYLNGQEYSFRRNFYHKPVASLNWDWIINDRSSLSAVLYASWGRGGGTGEIGRINGSREYSSMFKDANGLVRVDDIFAWNSGQTVTDFGGGPYNNPTSRDMFNGSYINTGNNGHPTSQGGEGKYGHDNGISRRASMNSHNWFGAIANFNHEINDNLTLDLGFDLRTYKGIHYRVVNDLLGADGYIDYDNTNAPASGTNITKLVSATPSWNPFQAIVDQQKIDYYNDGLVNWEGIFGQLEYSKDNISAFIQGAVSNQGFKRIEYFNESPGNQKTSFKNIMGGNVKGGLNWNIDEHNNVFANAGYYSRQPNFDAVYLNFGNNLNPNLKNEKVFGSEIGYGYRSGNYRVNLNLYRTEWKDRFISSSNTFFSGTPNEVRGVANLYGVKEVHSGVELESSARFGKFTAKLMGSVGKWEYKGNVAADYLDDSQNPIPGVGQKILYLDGVKVGDAAQITARLGFSYEITDGLKIDWSQNYFDKLYAKINAQDFDSADNKGSLQLPSYTLMNAGLSYRLNFKNKGGLNFRFNVNNLANTTYISESATNYHAESGDTTWNGINTSNRVYYGWGRTWNFSVRYSF